MKSRPHDDGGRFCRGAALHTRSTGVWTEPRDAAGGGRGSAQHIGADSTDENADKQEAAAASLVTVWKICSSRRQTESMADASARRDFQRDATAPMRRGKNPFHLVCCISAGRLTHIAADAKRSLSRPVYAGSRQLRLIRKQSDFLTDSGSSSSYGSLIFYIFFLKEIRREEFCTAGVLLRRVINLAPGSCQRSPRPL